MGAGDLGGDVEPEAEAADGCRASCRGRRAGTAGSIWSSGIGSPALATDSSKTPSAVRRIDPDRAVGRAVASARWRAGSRSSWPMRAGSTVTAIGRSIEASMLAVGFTARSSSTTCCSTGATSVARRSRMRPPPSRPRAKSSTLSISPAMRRTLFCISVDDRRAPCRRAASLQQLGRRRRSRRAGCAGRGRARR